MKETLEAVLRACCGDVEIRIAIDFKHQNGFIGPVFSRVLNYAEGIDPNVADIEGYCYGNSLYKRLW